MIAEPPQAQVCSRSVPRRWRAVRDVAGQASWLLSGKAVLVLSNVLLQLFVANRLPLDSYGILITLIGAQIFVSRVLLCGVNTGMIRLRTTDARWTPGQMVSAGFLVVGANSAILLAAGIAVRPVLVGVIGWPAWAFDTLIAGSIGMALLDYVYACHLARLHYGRAALAQAMPAVLRLGATAAAAVLAHGNGRIVFAAYAVSTLAGALVQVPFVHATHGGGFKRASAGRLLRYSLFCGATDVVAALGLHAGTFLITLSGATAEAGTYGFALTMSLGIFVLYNTAVEYLLPRVSRLKDARELPAFAAASGRALAGIVAAVALCLPAAGFVVRQVFQPHLWPSVPVFYVLAPAMLLLMLQAPLELACQYMLRADLVLAGWLLRVGLTAGLGALLLLRHDPSQAPGVMAAAQLAGGAAALVMMSGMTWIAWKRSTGGGTVDGRSPALESEVGVEDVGEPGLYGRRSPEPAVPRRIL